MLMCHDNDKLFIHHYQAHVVCIVYDLTQTDSLDRVSSKWLSHIQSYCECLLSQVSGYWLPLVRECSFGQTKPVVLAGNKVSYDCVCMSMYQSLCACVYVSG